LRLFFFGLSELQERDKQLDTALDKLSKLNQAWKNRLTLNNRRLAERYLNGTLRICVILNARRESSKFVAILNKYDTLTVAGGWNRHLEFGDPDFSLRNTGGVKKNANLVDSDNSRNQQSVLIEIVKFGDFPERRIPTVVRLHRLDEADGAWVDALYLSIKLGFVFGRTVVDREAKRLEVFSPGFQGKLADQMVKCRAEIMNGVADNEREIDRDWDQAEAYNCLSSLRVVLSNETLTVGFGPGHAPLCNIVDVLYGPFDLCHDGI
jgi:hypothetical protein